MQKNEFPYKQFVFKSQGHLSKVLVVGSGKEIQNVGKHEKSDLGFVSIKDCIVDPLPVNSSQRHKYIYIYIHMTI